MTPTDLLDKLMDLEDQDGFRIYVELGGGLLSGYQSVAFDKNMNAWSWEPHGKHPFYTKTLKEALECFINPPGDDEYESMQEEFNIDGQTPNQEAG